MGIAAGVRPDFPEINRGPHTPRQGVADHSDTTQFEGCLAVPRRLADGRSARRSCGCAETMSPPGPASPTAITPSWSSTAKRAVMAAKQQPAEVGRDGRFTRLLPAISGHATCGSGNVTVGSLRNPLIPGVRHPNRGIPMSGSG